MREVVTGVELRDSSPVRKLLITNDSSDSVDQQGFLQCGSLNSLNPATAKHRLLRATPLLDSPCVLQTLTVKD